MKRDLSIDYAKGIAILFVYLGHSVIYHPIDLTTMYHWCFILERMITSFNMPMFFVISGLLFGFSKKTNKVVISDKMRRLLVPYLFTMLIVTCSKFFLPAEMAKHKITGWGGQFLWDVFFHGGDRWFVYVLMWIFIISLPFRKIAKTFYIFIPITICLICSILKIMPEIFLSWKIVKYAPFFLLGMYCSQYYNVLKKIMRQHIIVMSLLFIVFNLILVAYFNMMPIMWDVVLPIIGTSLFWGVSVMMEDLVNRKGQANLLFKYVEYCGKYSLQFYLLTFAYPIIRFITVKYVSNPFLIVSIVMFLQLIVITIIVEITKRIKYLRIPLGY